MPHLLNRPSTVVTFSDNFNRADGALGADWTRLSLSSNATVEVVSNKAQITTGSSGSEAWYRYENGVGTSDVVVEADLTTPSSGTYYSGLLARIADSGAYGYRLVVASGNIELVRDGNQGGSAYAGGGTNSTHLDLSPDTFYTAPNTTYHLKLQVTGTGATVRVQAWVDDVQVYDASDTSGSRLTTGTKCGIYTYVSPTNTAVKWDNFTVSSASDASYPTGSAPVDDAFSGASLSSFWTAVDPLGDLGQTAGTFTVASDKLTISVPTSTGIDHDDWSSGRPVDRTCRVLQQIDTSNWTVETKVLNASTASNAFAGFRVISDFNNHLRADLDGDGANVAWYIAIWDGSSFSVQYNSGVGSNGPVLWIRMAKSGTTYTFNSSTNGTDWTQRASFTWTPTPRQLGLAAGSSSTGSSYAPEFEYFEVI